MSNSQPTPVSPGLFSKFEFTKIGDELREHESYEKHSKNARVLVKSDAFTMTLIALKKSVHMKEHHSPAPAAAIVLEGQVTLAALSEHQLYKLGPLESAVFSDQILHWVEAQEDSLLLLIFGQRT